MDVLVNAGERCVEQSEFIDIIYRLLREVGEPVVRLDEGCLRRGPMRVHVHYYLIRVIHLYLSPRLIKMNE